MILQQDNEGITISLCSQDDKCIPLIFLSLKKLNQIDTDFDEKDSIRDIPRNLFSEGDYYQSSVTKYTKDNSFENVSLLSIIHQILIDHKKDLLFIKSIFSSSLNYYQEEVFFHPKAIHFWNMQLNKSNDIPVSYFKEDKRYMLRINM